jgi:hypothetical protein
MSLPLTFGLHGTILKGAVGDIFASSGIPITIGLSGMMTYTPPREISCPIPLTFGMSGSLSYGIEGVIAFTLPILTVQFDGIVDVQGTLQFTLPMPTVYMTSHSSAEGILNVTIPKYSIKLTGSQDTQGSLNITLPMLSFRAAGSINESGSLNVTIPMLRFTGEAEIGNEGTLNITLPMYRIAMDGMVSAEGELNVTIPMILFHAEQAAEAGDYLNMVMNTKNKALSLFQNYDFNSLCAFGGKHFGATDTGIFDLDSDTKDNGAMIEWNWKTGYLDLEQIQKKKLVEAWLSYKTDGDIKFTVIQPNGEEYEYILQGIDPTETGLRLKFGRGIRTKYVALNVSNIDGSSIDLDELKLHLANSTFVKVR